MLQEKLGLKIILVFATVGIIIPGEEQSSFNEETFVAI
jgi:hypothetical protein